MKGTLTVQQMENFLGGLAPVDNAEDLRQGIEPLGKGAVVQLSFPAEGDTLNATLKLGNAERLLQVLFFAKKEVFPWHGSR